MTKNWWKEQVIYQIYPRSFNDSNGDGIGDIQGIINKLDYLENLGIDIIWLGPVYESPNDDNGYDISDYRKIHPEFGDIHLLKKLLDGLHQRGMKLIMDLVVNHTSDEHFWFQEARKSKDNPYRDYYIWKPAIDGKEPNNWPSFFSGSAWEWDEQTEEYYLHLFSRKQPDLNWENPKLRDEIYDTIKFWLEQGIDGFRMDVIPLISKRLEYADSHEPTFNKTIENVYSNGPRVHEFIQEMYHRALKDYDIMTVGEGPGINTKVGLDYVSSDRDELDMIFHLDHMFLGFGERGRFDQIPYDLSDIKRIFNDWYEAMGDKGWISIFLDNHDFCRMVSRFGNDQEYRVVSAKLLATLILTMPGTPCIYQGSEIGMTNIILDKLEEFKDVETINAHQDWIGRGNSTEEFIPLANAYGRDNARTPMQWNDQSNAGFTTGIPWIKVNPNFRTVNVENAISDENSILHFYRKILAYRKTCEAFVYGKYQMIDTEHPELFIYTRTTQKDKFTIVLNFSSKTLSFDQTKLGNLEVSNLIQDDKGTLQPWEANIYLEKIS